VLFRSLYWSLTRAGLRFGGGLSEGVKLGHDTGFDSGSTLDYVYRNVAQGKGALGRAIDRNYLEAIGWRGIRQRKIHVEELLRIAMERLAEMHREVRLMDIAAGHGRYVLDAVLASPVKASSILLRDYSEINVRDGRALIAEKGLEDVAQFVQADAFDRMSLASVTPRPTLAVVSGLYELFPDNEMVRRSLAGVGDAVEDGGYLVYTGQPWHPQLEMIARALTSHRQGEAWVMRRRTQVEMDQLVEEAGFRKIDQRSDEWGIFTVSLARRTEALSDAMRAWFAARPWKRAAGWLAVLGPLFYLTYGLANWWATTRAQVPSMAFAWERQVPFWPWTIFPYWTINVFYALSLFLARDRHTLDRHGARLVSATLIACSCFVIWPLHFSFGQPAVEGAPAFLFAALRGFDQPYNQAPSLHIALAVILWDWYRQFIRPRWARAVLHLWAFAICASVLTTWQHHFIDIPTGALLGLFCIWLWPLRRTVSMPRAWRLARDPQRWKLAACYALGALACLALALWGGGWALWLAWPAASLALVALNYAGFGARGFQMDGQGRMGWAARWLFAPYRLGAALNARLWTRGLPPEIGRASCRERV